MIKIVGFRFGKSRFSLGLVSYFANNQIIFFIRCSALIFFDHRQNRFISLFYFNCSPTVTDVLVDLVFVTKFSDLDLT